MSKNVRIRGIPQGAITFRDDNEVPKGFAKCDGTNGTPDLRGKHLVGASSSIALKSSTTSPSVNGSHSHTAYSGSATHTFNYTKNVDSTIYHYFDFQISHSQHSILLGTGGSISGMLPEIALNPIKSNSKNVRCWLPAGVTLKTINNAIYKYNELHPVGENNNLGSTTADTLQLDAHSHSVPSTTGGYSNTHLNSKDNGTQLYTTSHTEWSSSNPYHTDFYVSNSHTHPLSGSCGTSSAAKISPPYTYVAFFSLQSVNVRKDIPSGIVVAYELDTIPNGWIKCDGTNGTPNLQGRLLKFTTNISNLGTNAGDERGNHTHSLSLTIDNANQIFDVNSDQNAPAGDSTGCSLTDTFPVTFTHNHPAPTSVSGNGLSSPYYPPYYAVHFIMKV